MQRYKSEKLPCLLLPWKYPEHAPFVFTSVSWDRHLSICPHVCHCSPMTPSQFQDTTLFWLKTQNQVEFTCLDIPASSHFNPRHILGSNSSVPLPVIRPLWHNLCLHKPHHTKKIRLTFLALISLISHMYFNLRNLQGINGCLILTCPQIIL